MNNKVMVVVRLEDGREKVLSKRGVPEEFNLNNSADKKWFKNFNKTIKNKKACYNKSLEWMGFPEMFNKKDRVYIKNYRYKKYDKTADIFPPPD